MEFVTVELHCAFAEKISEFCNHRITTQLIFLFCCGLRFQPGFLVRMLTIQSHREFTPHANIVAVDTAPE